VAASELHSAYGTSTAAPVSLPSRKAASASLAWASGKNIRFAGSGDGIDCKIEGFGAMSLKSELAQKA